MAAFFPIEARVELGAGGSAPILVALPDPGERGHIRMRIDLDGDVQLSQGGEDILGRPWFGRETPVLSAKPR